MSTTSTPTGAEVTYRAGETVYIDGDTKATVLFNTHNSYVGDRRVVVNVNGIGGVKVDRERVSRERRDSAKSILQAANTGPITARPAYLSGYLSALVDRGRGDGLSATDRARIQAAADLLLTLGTHKEVQS